MSAVFSSYFSLRNRPHVQDIFENEDLFPVFLKKYLCEQVSQTGGKNGSL